MPAALLCLHTEGAELAPSSCGEPGRCASTEGNSTKALLFAQDFVATALRAIKLRRPRGAPRQRAPPSPPRVCGVGLVSPLNGTRGFEGTRVVRGRLYGHLILAGAFTMTPEDRYTAIARECVRLAELTDNQDLRDHLKALALDMMAQAIRERDDHLNVIEFPRRA
jgi:hypothetical protein